MTSLHEVFKQQLQQNTIDATNGKIFKRAFELHMIIASHLMKTKRD